MKYKQQYDFSCGAVALMCAAGELGITRIPGIEGGAAPGGNWDNGDFLLTPRLENALYWVTSGYTMNSYSMPDGVVTCARRLGLQARIHNPPGVFASLLARVYPSALKACELKNFPIDVTAPPSLETNQRELVVVSTFVAGLHYVMRRPGDSYMDPADGEDYQGFAALNTWTKCYQRTGLSILITGNEPGAAGE
jgi:hypothetical protein